MIERDARGGRRAGGEKVMTPAVFLKYLWYVIRHKWYVFEAGRRMAPPCGFWQLFVHDWQKFSPAEFPPYAKHFYGRTPHTDRREDPAFERAFLHHLHFGPHHWEHWCVPNRKPLRVPDKYLREMAADWLAMACMFNNPQTKWYGEHRAKIVMHPESRAAIERLLGYEMPSQSVLCITATVAVADHIDANRRLIPSEVIHSQ